MSLNYLIPLGLYVATAHPAAYKATRGIFGSWVASADGLASTAGVVLHAIVFVLVAGFLMRLLNPRASGYKKQTGYTAQCKAPAGTPRGNIPSGQPCSNRACACQSWNCVDGICT